MTSKSSFDPDSLTAILAQTLHRLTLEDPKPLETFSEFPLPITETLITVLLEQPALESGASPAAVRALTEGRTALASYVGFDFAIRCISAILLDPLGDHRDEFLEAARVSSLALQDDPEGDLRSNDRDVDERFSLRASLLLDARDRELSAEERS